MRETITINRITTCSLTGKEVAQQLSAYVLDKQENRPRSEILTKYCSGESACNSTDCQFIVGLAGKTYSKAIDGIFRYINEITP
ncbi:hypothetical protein [Sporomusa aerivorans]|uniref:hypothetical protein n=1 Tax=Sporomusa aerivorans TaxID=204936 RepID=UPI00352B6287